MATKEYKVVTHKVTEGVLGRLWCTYPVMRSHWMNCIELQEQSQTAFMQNFINEVLALPYRFEISIQEKGSNEFSVVGIIAPDIDPHVGLCFAVQVTYSYKNSLTALRLLLQEYKRIAKEHNVNVLRIPKRVRDWEYSVKYIKI